MINSSTLQDQQDGQDNLENQFKKAISLEKSDPNAMFSMLKSLALDKNYSKAFNMLSECYRSGIGVQIDENKVFEIAMMGSERGDEVSMYYVGNCYFYGLAREVDVAQAMEWYKKSGNAGYGMGCMAVANQYHTVDSDFDQAMEWYLKGAELGSGLCFHRIGYMYERGLGCKKDQKNAFDNYLKAANLGISSSMYNLGVCYESGIGCQVDEKKSKEWFIRAAKSNNEQAITKVIFRCTQGIVWEYDFSLAYELMSLDPSFKSSFIDFCSGYSTPISKFYIAQERYYEKPRNNVYNSKIIELLESTQTCYQSQNLLGIIYLEGEIVEKDLKKAFELIEKSAESNNEKCLLDLAIMYLYGYGCKKDSLEARWRLKQLAIGGYQSAVDILDGSFFHDLWKNGHFCDIEMLI